MPDHDPRTREATRDVIADAGAPSPLADAGAPAAPADPRAAREWETDRLVTLAARALGAPADMASLGEQFLEWQARELRAMQRSDDGWSDARVAALAERLRVRALAARLGVRLVGGAPPERRAPTVAPLALVIEEANDAGCAPRLDLGIAAGSGRELWDEPCESWLTLDGELPRGRYVALTVRGDSMEPLLHSGDVILVRMGPDLARDAVVVAHRPDEGFVVKRVGDVTRAQVELLSLNPAFPPIVLRRDADTIAGTVVMRWCTHGEGMGSGAL